MNYYHNIKTEDLKEILEIHLRNLNDLYVARARSTDYVSTSINRSIEEQQEIISNLQEEITKRVSDFEQKNILKKGDNIINYVQKLRIFLASPNDVRRERQYVHEVVNEINRTIASEKRIILELVTSDSAFPAYGTDGQEIINRQIGKMETYELFIGIMWSRIGTPTQRDISGTVEELNRAINALEEIGKPLIWFYFRDASIKAKDEEGIEQIRGVMQLKRDLAKKGLYREYSTPIKFKDRLRIDILTWLSQRTLNINDQH